MALTPPSLRPETLLEELADVALMQPRPASAVTLGFIPV